MGDFSKDFPLDAGIFTSGKLSLSGSTDADAAKAIVTNDKFPPGNIELGRIAFSADGGKVEMKPIDGASVSFDIAGSLRGGMGVYATAADAIQALQLKDAPALGITDANGERYLLMDWGYGASISGSVSHPVGVLGSVSFGVDAKRNALYAVLQRFGANDKAHEVVERAIANWMLPRHVAFTGTDVNLRPGTWVLAEADGTLALKLASSLGWNVSFAKEAKLLGITHNLSSKIDASLKATFGFSVSGKYIVAVGRADASQTVRLSLFKQSSKGLDFGFNVTVGVQGADPQLPANSDDFIKATFGLHGLQVLKDLRTWTDPKTDLGQKLAGLADQTALDLVKKTTGIDPEAEFDKAKQSLGEVLKEWDSLPEKLSSMLWTYLDGLAGAPIAADFKAFLEDLADPKKGADVVAKTLQKATFGDTPQGQFLEAIADRGLLELTDHSPQVQTTARQVLNIVNGGTIAKLQKYIEDALDLGPIRKAISDADFQKVNQWLQNRLGIFLDKTLGLDDLRDVQKAIQTLDKKAGDYYKAGVQALTKRYSVDFAATYQKTTAGTALIDVLFDLSLEVARQRFAEVVGGSNLDSLLTQETKGVTLNQATLTHEINHKGTVDLHMPFFDFSSTHLNDAVATLTAEEQGGRVLLYQIDAKDKVTVANRAASQLAVLASVQLGASGPPKLESDGSIAYEMRQVKADMRPLELEARTTAFIHDYLGGLFGGSDASIRNFYADLDNALTVATHNASNHLGDVALSMQLTLPATVLSGWFQPRSASQLQSDQMRLSRALQTAWKKALPALYFRDLDQYQPTAGVAALLVWSAIRATTTFSVNGDAITIDTDKSVIWDVADIEQRRVMARSADTAQRLAGRLTGVQTQLQEAERGSADFFAPNQTRNLVEQALNATGDFFLTGLLFTEAQLVRGAAGALKDISGLFGNPATAPTKAIQALAAFAADLTDTFNHRVASLYAGISGRVAGPLLLVQSSAALGSAEATPKAMLNLYALNPGHTFSLGTFVDGKNPPKSDVALTQTLVSL